MIPTFDSETERNEHNMHTDILTLMHSTSDVEDDDIEKSTDVNKLTDTKNNNPDKMDSPLPSITKNGSNADLINIIKSQQDSKMCLPNTKYNTYHKPITFNEKNYIDAWWLCDDGGLNILLPYIIARRGCKDKIPLRIFALTKGQLCLNEAKKHMEELLAKFRIEYSNLTLVQGIGEPPTNESWELWNSIIKDFKTTENSEILISDAEHKSQYAKISRHLRLRELLLQHSYKADLIAITLPFPRKGAVSAAMYMSWLEVMSHSLPPTLFVRGNHSYVLDA